MRFTTTTRFSALAAISALLLSIPAAAAPAIRRAEVKPGTLRSKVNIATKTMSAEDAQGLGKALGNGEPQVRDGFLGRKISEKTELASTTPSALAKDHVEVMTVKTTTKESLWGAISRRFTDWRNDKKAASLERSASRDEAKAADLRSQAKADSADLQGQAKKLEGGLKVEAKGHADTARNLRTASKALEKAGQTKEANRAARGADTAQATADRLRAQATKEGGALRTQAKDNKKDLHSQATELANRAKASREALKALTEQPTPKGNKGAKTAVAQAEAPVAQE